MIIILAVLGFAVVSCFGVWLWSYSRFGCFWDIAAIVSLVLVGFVLLTLLFSHLDARETALEIGATRITIESMRAQGQTWELAAMGAKIAELNSALAQAKYWKRHPATSWFLPRYILDIEPLK